MPESVADVVVRLPKTLPADARLAAARAALDDDHVHMVLLTHRGRLVGTILRSDLPDIATAGAVDERTEAAAPYAVLAGRTVSSHVPAEDARRIMIHRGQRRLAVVDDEGTLLGLLCLKRGWAGFCSDTDVAARAADRRALAPGRS